MFESTDEKVAQMQEAEDIISRLLKGLYLDEEVEAFQKKYPRKPSKLGVDGLWHSESTHDKPEGAIWRALSKRIRAAETADWKRLGQIISTNLEGWWD